MAIIVEVRSVPRRFLTLVTDEKRPQLNTTTEYNDTSRLGYELDSLSTLFVFKCHWHLMAHNQVMESTGFPAQIAATAECTERSAGALGSNAIIPAHSVHRPQLQQHQRTPAPWLTGVGCMQIALSAPLNVSGANEVIKPHDILRAATATTDNGDWRDCSATTNVPPPALHHRGIALCPAPCDWKGKRDTSVGWFRADLLNNQSPLPTTSSYCIGLLCCNACPFLPSPSYRLWSEIFVIDTVGVYHILIVCLQIYIIGAF
ncbi:unnamed protein product [Ceratitis capitata]|uniref:(Mediterranean fruit fly) hypothetical protein n=1 Tax=Ceratitis capitata TaxID=7213 RepID=A0A811UZG4_CERCA|nr:unnamed protein product [Ceratitis capitata]